MQTQQQIFDAQTAARSKAERYSYLDFTCMFDGTSFDEEVETDKGWMGLCRDESGMLQVHAELVYDGEVDADGERMGTGWYL